MQAVGRIGSYISRSVYTVSGPFHPFGGAVDIIVVQQPDGSYKSSPWYVRFGKFQGVLKTKEKVVNISVNGVESDFHMYLDHKGEAFFLKEIYDDGGESACSPPSSSGEDTDRQTRNRPVKSKSCNLDSDWSNSVDSGGKPVVRTNSKRAQILGLVFGRRSKKEEEEEEEHESGVIRTESLDRADIAANLLDLKWSTNLASPRRKKDNASRFSSADISKDDEGNENLKVDDDGCGCDEAGVVSHPSYKEVEFTVEGNGVEMKCLTSEYVVETETSVESVGEDNTLTNDKVEIDRSDYCVSAVEIVSEVAKSDSQSQESKLNGLSETILSEEESAINSSQSFNNSEALDSSGAEIKNIQGFGDQFGFIHEEKMSMNGDTLTECYSQSISVHQSNDSLNKVVEEQTALGKDEINKHAASICDSEISVEEQLLFGDMDGFDSTDAKQLQFILADHEVRETDSSFLSGSVDVAANDHCNAKSCVGYSLEQSVINDYIDGGTIQRRSLKSISSDVCISEKGHAQSKGLARMVRSLPTMGHLSTNLEASDPGRSSDPLLYPENNDHQSSCAQTTGEDVQIPKVTEGEPAKSAIGNPPRPIEPLRGSRRSWPFFKKSRSMQFSQADKNGIVDPNAIDISNNSSDLEGEKDSTKLKVNKKILKTLTPTSEQLASLNLKEGKNIVIFTFSTAMLGKQQVDARIFLWRWDTRIVISDVDGTITRSDLLGQVMPLVGMDWSQTGVTHLFSAIKENGYQLIFLSARSISQSFHTRQFLFNIKQDGKALPEGPVVISPDGLFPSLFREVVRRAPHEFKIACLEDIKALFPADTNPFYAGFGNRDTDEFSYLKVGIPRGKIFIINPKGEIVVNRRVDTKSYLSLHELVHDMFPSMCSSEKEDYNSWNFWKLPPPTID